jgi:DNA topoisomerase-1
LGTKATRSHILHTLYERDYIKENSIEVTELGKSVVNALEKYCAEVVSPHLTKEFEQDMEAIVEGKKKRKEIVENAEKVLEPIFQKFKSNELRIGKELLEGFKEALREESLVGKCTCGGDLLIRMSHKGKRFVGCSKYPKCTQTFSLPQHGYISITHKTCEKCGLNILSVKSRGKWPWKLCIRDGFVIKRKPKAGASRKQAAKPAPKAGAKPTAKTVTKTKKQVTRTKR